MRTRAIAGRDRPRAGRRVTGARDRYEPAKMRGDPLLARQEIFQDRTQGKESRQPIRRVSTRRPRARCAAY